MKENLTGDSNLAFGTSAMETSNGSRQNVAVGMNSLRFGQGSFNVAIGTNALGAPGSTAELNLSIGINSLLDLTNGSGNLALGGNAGRGKNGSGNVYIGLNAGFSSSLTSESNKLYIYDILLENK